MLKKILHLVWNKNRKKLFSSQYNAVRNLHHSTWNNLEFIEKK